MIKQAIDENVAVPGEAIIQFVCGHLRRVLYTPWLAITPQEDRERVRDACAGKLCAVCTAKLDRQRGMR